MKYLFLSLVLCFTLNVTAQQSDSQLAYTYYQNKEYVKAAEIFLQLYQRSRSSYYLDYHIICLINAKDYDKAEQVLKKFLKTDENNNDYLINLGYIYDQQGKAGKSEEYYQKAIKKLIPHPNSIQNLASKFQNIREYDWANKTYIKGRELLKQPDAFLMEIGENCMLDRNYEEMIKLYIQALQNDPGKLNTITSKLSFARTYDINNSADDIIQTALNTMYKTSNYNPVFDELGIWYALQTGNYTNAFNSAVKLNTKLKEKSYVYINIAQEAARAEKYKIAEEAYTKILQQGKENNSYYYTAQKEILNCQYEDCRHNHTATSEQYKKIASECENFIKEWGYTNTNTDIITLLSDLYAYRLNMPDTANSILRKGENINRLDAYVLSVLKSKRADLLTYMNNPWEAVILYTQIEKSNPNNDIGYEAKLKKAQLAYYQGDLLWAKAQYDVLKGSTSKLISNDALKMSHFINNNYEEEEDNSDLIKLAQTEYYIYKNQFDIALPTLDSLIANSQPEIADYTTLIKAQILLSQHKINEAIALWEKLKNDSGQDYIRAEAIFKLANQKAGLNEKQQAMDLYKLLVSDYSGSVYSVEAGKKYRDLEK